MADQKRRIEIELAANADQVVAASRESERALQRVIEVTKTAGRDSTELEQQLADLKRQNAEAWTQAYVAGLEEFIAKEREAGRETDALEAGLQRLKTSTAGAADDFAKLRAEAAKGGGEFNFKSLSRADVDAALKSAEGSAGFLGRLRGQFSELAAQFPLLSRIGSAVSTLASGPLALLAAGIGAVAAGWRGARAALHAYLADSERMAAFDSVLAQQGQLTASLRDRYIELANELQKVTGIADDRWIATIQRLIQFGSRPESLGVDVETVKNLAGITGDVATATELYAKALQGSFGTLSRYGIIVDENASRTEKLAQLQRLAAERGAGVLEAQARSLGGELKNLRNEIGDLAEGFGRLAFQNRFAQNAVGITREVVQAFTALLPEATKQLEGLTNRQRSLAEASRVTADTLQQIGDQAAKTADEGLQRVNDQLDRLQERFARGFDAQRDQIRRAQQLADAQLALELKRLEQQEKRGEVSRPEAAQRRFDLEQQRAESRRDAERRARALDIEEAEKELELQRANLQRDLEPPRDRAAAEVQRLEREQALLEEVRNRFLRQLEAAGADQQRVDALRTERAEAVGRRDEELAAGRPAVAANIQPTIDRLDRELTQLQAGLAQEGRETIEQLVQRLAGERDTRLREVIDELRAERAGVDSATPAGRTDAARLDRQIADLLRAAETLRRAPADPAAGRIAAERGGALVASAQDRVTGAVAARESGDVEQQRAALQAEFDRNAEALARARAQLEKLNAAVDAQAKANERLEAAVGDRIAGLRRDQALDDELARLQQETAALTREAARADEQRAAAAAALEADLQAFGQRLGALVQRLGDSPAAAADAALARTIDALEKQARAIATSAADPAQLATAEENLRKVYDAATAAGSPVATELQQLGRSLRAFRELLEAAAAREREDERRRTKIPDAPSAATTPPAPIPTITAGGKRFAVDPDGFLVDLARPVVRQPDGATATEKTATVEVDQLNRGRPTNIPTIVAGQEVPLAEAIRAALDQAARGFVFPNFATVPEAEAAARRRSEFIGRVRATDLAEAPVPPAPRPPVRPSGAPASPPVSDGRAGAPSPAAVPPASAAPPPPASEVPPTPAPDLAASVQALQDAAAALNAAAEDLSAAAGEQNEPIPRRVGGRIPPRRRVLVGEEGPEILEPEETAAGGNIVPAPETRRIVAAAEDRTAADPGRAGGPSPAASGPTQPAPPAPPTPPNPSGSGMTNAEWKSYFQADPARGRAFAESRRTREQPPIRSNAEAIARQEELNRAKGFAPPPPVIRSNAEALAATGNAPGPSEEEQRTRAALDAPFERMRDQLAADEQRMRDQLSKGRADTPTAAASASEGRTDAPAPPASAAPRPAAPTTAARPPASAQEIGNVVATEISAAVRTMSAAQTAQATEFRRLAVALRSSADTTHRLLRELVDAQSRVKVA